MAVKAGQIIHVGNDTVVIDRIQTAGPGNLNIPIETIYELGNYKSVGQIRDTPDLAFSLESYDVSTEIEALLLGVDPTDATKLPYDPANGQPLDMKSVFKAGLGASDAYAEVASVGLPFLALEQLSYRFGLKDDARQTASLRGDSVYYNPGSTYVETTAGPLAAGATVATAKPAYSIDEGGVVRRVLAVTSGGKRLLYGVDYTEAYGTITDGAAVTTLTLVSAAPNGVRLMYSSPTVEELPQSIHALASITKPAAIRGRDIAVYFGAYDPANPFTNRIHGVQAVTVDWRVTLEKDEEFGNYHYVDQDFEVPTVTGTVQIKPTDAAALIELIQTIAGTASPTMTPDATAAPIIPFTVVLHSPVDGSVLKTLTIPDARMTVPGFSARVQQKLDVTINIQSDTGELLIGQS